MCFNCYTFTLTHTHKHTVFEQIDFVYLFVFTNLSANVHSNQWNIIEFTLAADRFTFHTRIRQKEAEAAEDGMRQKSRSLCVCVCVGNEVRNKTPTKFTQNLENNLTAFRYRNCFRSNRYRWTIYQTLQIEFHPRAVDKEEKKFVGTHLYVFNVAIGRHRHRQWISHIHTHIGGKNDSAPHGLDSNVEQIE